MVDGTQSWEKIMRADVKSELMMLRELVWLHIGCSPVDQVLKLVGWKFCYFCHHPLLPRPANMTFGHRRHPKIDVDITQHHIDENRENNNPSNLADCHSHCHKSYHAQKRALVRKEAEKLGQEEKTL